MKATNSKNIKKIILTILIVMILLALIIWQIGDIDKLNFALGYLLSKIKTGNAWMIFLAIFLAPVSWLIESIKWKYLTSKFAHITLFKSLSSVMTGMSFAFISPGKVGDFVGRMLYFDEKTRFRSVIAVLVGNLAHVMVTFLMGIIGLIILIFIAPGWWQLSLLIGAIAIGGVLAYLYFNLNRLSLQAKNPKSFYGKFLTALKILKRYSKKDLLKVCFFSLLKFSTYTIQFLIIAAIFGAEMNWILGFFIAAVMFWMIMVIPSFFIADIIVRGYVAELLFVSTSIVNSSVAVLGGTYTIWIINWVLPSIIGALTLLVYRLFNKNSTK